MWSSLCYILVLAYIWYYSESIYNRKKIFTVTILTVKIKIHGYSLQHLELFEVYFTACVYLYIQFDWFV